MKNKVGKNMNLLHNEKLASELKKNNFKFVTVIFIFLRKKSLKIFLLLT